MNTVNNKELYGTLKQSLSGNAVIENLPILELDGDIDISDVKFYHKPFLQNLPLKKIALEERLLKT